MGVDCTLNGINCYALYVHILFLLLKHSVIAPVESFYVVMEYVANDNLRNFLRKSRKTVKSMGREGKSYVSNLNPGHLLNFAVGVAKAMVHISSAGVRIFSGALY